MVASVCRFFLAMSARKRSKLYKINGILLAVAFFVARIMVYGWGLWHMWEFRWALDLSHLIRQSCWGARRCPSTCHS